MDYEFRPTHMMIYSPWAYLGEPRQSYDPDPIPVMCMRGVWDGHYTESWYVDRAGWYGLEKSIHRGAYEGFGWFFVPIAPGCDYVAQEDDPRWTTVLELRNVAQYLRQAPGGRPLQWCLDGAHELELLADAIVSGCWIPNTFQLRGGELLRGYRYP